MVCEKKEASRILPAHKDGRTVMGDLLIERRTSQADICDVFLPTLASFEQYRRTRGSQTCALDTSKGRIRSCARIPVIDAPRKIKHRRPSRRHVKHNETARSLLIASRYNPAVIDARPIGLEADGIIGPFEQKCDEGIKQRRQCA